ncbi:MAG: MaoC/PaaZ C-terminal domain-containing protein [Dehalococcoidia bacterium]
MKHLIVDEVEVGDELPSLVKVPSTQQLVRYAGAANDYSSIHFDDRHARRRGFDGVIVHGALKAAFLGQMLTEWCADAGWVKRFDVRYHSIDVPNRPLVCRGRVESIEPAGEPQRIELLIWVENPEGKKSTTGTATIVLGAPPLPRGPDE